MEKSSIFDKVIGYESIKKELFQLCDMVQNKEVYSEMGAAMPRGVLLVGDPGLGKTMLCKAFIERSGLPAFTIRKNRSDEEFVSSITDAFNEAKEKAPSIVFLDDMDKYANEDCNHRDAEAYVAVQAGIDEVANACVFVIATVNETEKLPPALTRSGRFDRIIEIDSPSDEDAEKIIKYYLSNKKVGDDVNYDDLAKMIRYSSCAELETIINEAAISAAYNRKEHIEMSDLVNSVLRMQYKTTDATYSVTDKEEIRRRALHEAGHMVCSEILCPDSVGLVSIRSDRCNGLGGFVHRCKAVSRRPYYILVALAAKVAVELYYSDHVASGCGNDIDRAVHAIYEGLSENATAGLGLIDLPVRSSNLVSSQGAVTQALLEMYTVKAKNILLQNRAFLELATEELMNKGILLHSDIQDLKKKVRITEMSQITEMGDAV